MKSLISQDLHEVALSPRGHKQLTIKATEK